MELKMLLLKFGIIAVFQVQNVLLKGFTLEPITASWDEASGVCGTSGHILVPGRRYRAKAIRKVIADGQSVWLNGWRTTSEPSPDNSGRLRSLKIDFSRAYKKEVRIVCLLESIFYDPLHSALSSDDARDICDNDNATLADVLTLNDVYKVSLSMATDTPYWINSISPQGSKIKQCLVATRIGDDLKYTYDDCSTERNFLCLRDDDLISTFSPVISLKMIRFEEFRQLIEEYDAAISSSADTTLPPPSQISLEPSPTVSTAQITFTETPVQTLPSETPVQMLSSETPFQTISSQSPVQTLSSQSPEQTLSSSAQSTSYLSAHPMSSSSIHSTTTRTTALETSSESLATFDLLTTTAELSSAHTAQFAKGVNSDTRTRESFLIPTSATIGETIQLKTSQLTQSAIVDVTSSSSSEISPESRSSSDSSDSHQFKQYSFVNNSDYYEIVEQDDTKDYISSMSNTIGPTSTMSATTISVPPTLETMQTIPSETTSLIQSKNEFLTYESLTQPHHYQTIEIGDSLYTQSTDSLTLGHSLVSSSVFSKVLQPTGITASPSYKLMESSTVLTDDLSIIIEDSFSSMQLLSSSVYTSISSDVSTTLTATPISGATTGIIMTSEVLVYPSSSYVDTVMYKSDVQSLPTSDSTSESSITSSSYGCMVKDYRTFCPDTTRKTDLQTSVSHEVQTTISMDTDIESVIPDMPISITPILQITSTIQVDYDEDDKIDEDTDDDYEVTISDTVTPIYTINTSDSIADIGKTTDKIDNEIDGDIDTDGKDDDEEGNASSDNQGGIVKQKKEKPEGGEEVGLWIAFGVLIILVLVSLILAYILYRRRNRQSKDIAPVNGAATSGETLELRDSRSPSRENGKPRESTTYKNHAYDI